MLFILNSNYEVVGILNHDGDLTKISIYFDDEYVQDLSSGAETFKFSTLANIEQSQHLITGNYVAFKHEEEIKLFNIIQIEETHNDNFIKNVYCEMAGIELLNEIVRPMKVLNSDLRKFLQTILEDTEWSLGKVDASFNEIFDFDIKDYKTVYNLIQEYAVGKYGAEISYRVEMENNVITAKYLDCYRNRGDYNGFRFAYGSNLTSVIKTVDASNIATALIGVGTNGITFKEVEAEDKPKFQDFIVDEEAYKKWNVGGNHIFGIHKAETSSPQELLKLTRQALKERSVPKVKYEMKAELLGKDVKIGDTVAVIDHEFNPPLYLSARINQLKKHKSSPDKDEVVLANFKEVSSNITDEMRDLAAQLEGYVDSKFPIGGDQIKDGAIGENQIDKQYHTQVIADSVTASLVETEKLVADKASIEDLEATNAKIENLEAENVIVSGKLEAAEAEIGDLKAENVIVSGKLEAAEADIGKLKAENVIVSGKLEAAEAEIDDLISGNITVNGKLDAVEAEIDILKADVADIDNILAGNITADNIQAGSITANEIAAGTITAGSGIIADGAIGSAQISSLDAAKIDAGNINTSKVTISGPNNNLKISGNRLQVFKGIGSSQVERVSLGDVDGDGTKYGLRVRGEDGETILYDENGVYREGITDGSINNDKISSDANIDGAKLNINSVINKINEDGTETIDGVKIEVDGTTLNTKLSSITMKQDEDSERITQAQSQISANTESIKLKVDEQTYTTDKKGTESKLEKHTSEIEALKGEISLKVDKNNIEQIIDEVSGELIDKKVEAAKSEIKITTDKISQNVSSLTETVSNKADGSTVSSLSNKVSSLETGLNGIKGQVSNLETTTSSFESKINQANNTANSAKYLAEEVQLTTNENKNSISEIKGEIKNVKSSISSLEVTTSGISQQVSRVESTTANLTGKVESAQNTANDAKEEAENASNIADSKAKVFTSTPIPPYKVGDLWVQGSGGDLMKCKVARLSGSYNSSDWDKASKYTDDTKANSVDDKVDILRGEYNSTKSQVAEINTSLDSITQRVSSTESTTIKLTQEVNNANQNANKANQAAEDAKNTAEENKVEIQSTKNKVSSIESNLSSITSKVENVSNEQTKVNNKVTSLENRMSSAESKITEDAITNTVKRNFYTKNETENAIISKGYQTSSQVQQTVDELQIKFQESGGYNLIYNGNFKDVLNNWDSVYQENWVDNLDCPENNYGVKLNGSIGNSNHVRQELVLNSDKPITISFWQYTSRSGADGTTNPFRTFEASVYYDSDASASKWIGTEKQTNFDKWEKRKITYNPKNDGRKIGKLILSFYNRDTTKTVKYTNIMVEYGEIDTNYTPNPNEVSDGIVSISKSGILVKNSESETSTRIDSSSFSVENSNGGTVAEFSTNSYIPRLVVDDLDVRNEINAPNIIKMQNATNYYVDLSSGSDNNDGLSTSKSFKTIQKAVDSIEKYLSGHVTINIRGTGSQSVNVWGFSGERVLKFYFENGTKLHCNQFDIVGCDCDVQIVGNDSWSNSVGQIIQNDNGSCIYTKACKYVRVYHLCICGAGKGKGRALVSTGGSNAMMDSCEVDRFQYAARAENSGEVVVLNSSGSDLSYIIGGNTGGRGYLQNNASAPNADTNIENNSGFFAFGGSGIKKTNGTIYPATSSPAPPPPPATTNTRTWSFNKIYSDETLNGWPNKSELIQGYASTWNTGRWTGYMKFNDDMSSIKSALSGATNLSGRIYLQRRTTAGNSTGSKVCLYASDGTTVTTSVTLNRGKSVWISIPSSILTKIQNGSVKYFYVKADSNNTATYIKYESNPKIEITYKK